tara:strand:- start:171 stop:1535 length:1365 start_codon:yes stop_codon:yes gene_type:complete
MSNKITIVDKSFTVDGENYLQYWRTTDVETGIITGTGGVKYKEGESSPLGAARQFSGEAPADYPTGNPDFSAPSAPPFEEKKTYPPEEEEDNNYSPADSDTSAIANHYDEDHSHGSESTDNVSDAINDAAYTAGYASNQLSPFDGKISKDPLAGLDNTRVKESIPKYNDAPCEKVIRGKNNTWIVLGRDRNMGWSSGYGGRGHTRAGAIDIVTGLQGWGPQRDQVVEKNFGSMGNDKPGDAARIYISQRADIDQYFDICDGSMGQSKAMSAIGIKADSVRIMGRRGIKIVTGQAPQQRSSVGSKLPAQFGIDLIAGNRDDVPALSGKDPVILGFPVTLSQPYLQPIPKGLNLRECLEETLDTVSQLNELLTDFMGRQMIINCALAGSPITGMAGPIPVAALSSAIPTVTDGTIKQIANVFAELIKHQINITTMKTNYLDPTGPIYINSRYNRTN